MLTHLEKIVSILSLDQSRGGLNDLIGPRRERQGFRRGLWRNKKINPNQRRERAACGFGSLLLGVQKKKEKKKKSSS